MLTLDVLGYGFEIMEEYNPEKYPEHLEAKRKFNDKLDGRIYVRNVIEWHVCKVSSSITCLLFKYLA